MVARETHFRRIPARRYWVTLEGIVESGPNKEGVREQFEAIAAASPSHERARAFMAEIAAAEEAKQAAEAAAAMAADAGTAPDAGTTTEAVAEKPKENQQVTASPDKGKTETAMAEKPPEKKPVDPDKLLAQAGLTSRRGAERLITDGRVAINGVVTRELATLADPPLLVRVTDSRVAVKP